MRKQVGIKQLWRCVFSYNCGLEREFVYAYTNKQAKVLACRRLARKHGIHPSHVYALFDGSRANFSVEPEILFKEVD